MALTAPAAASRRASRPRAPPCTRVQAWTMAPAACCFSGMWDDRVAQKQDDISDEDMETVEDFIDVELDENAK